MSDRPTEVVVCGGKTLGGREIDVRGGCWWVLVDVAKKGKAWETTGRSVVLRSVECVAKVAVSQTMLVWW
jgi:hypothetical protein